MNITYTNVTKLSLQTPELPDHIQSDIAEFLMASGYADDDQEIEFKNFVIEADIYNPDIPLDELAYADKAFVSVY